MIKVIVVKVKGESSEYLLKSRKLKYWSSGCNSDTQGTQGVKVDISITKEGQVVKQALDKLGNLKVTAKILEGTVDESTMLYTCNS